MEKFIEFSNKVEHFVSIAKAIHDFTSAVEEVSNIIQGLNETSSALLATGAFPEVDPVKQISSNRLKIESLISEAKKQLHLLKTKDVVGLFSMEDIETLLKLNDHIKMYFIFDNLKPRIEAFERLTKFIENN